MNTAYKRLLPLTAAGCAAGLALAAVPASAKTTTLHFFEKQVTATLVDANGQPVAQNQMPAPGDRLEVTNLDYVGTHKHHAKRAASSSHIECTVTTASAATCSAQLAIGGAMLLASEWTLNLATNGPTTLPLTGGTGRYEHAHGTVHVVPVGTTNNNDVTVKFTG